MSGSSATIRMSLPFSAPKPRHATALEPSTVEHRMRQVFVSDGELALREVAEPRPATGQVLVRVSAAGLNRADLLQRRGGYPAPPGWPQDVPGLEFAGEVESAGPEASRWKQGDRVMGLVGGGAQSELLAVHEAELMPVPPNMELSDAAAVPEAFLTAYDALRTRGRLQAGERVLVHAVGSGVGTAALQVARLWDAIVVGTSRTTDKLEQASALGLHVAINTGERGFAEAMREPVDVVIDPLGAPALSDNLSVLAPGGRLVLIGFLQGSRADVDLAPLLRKRIEIIGTLMRPRQHSERVDVVRRFADDVLPALESGLVRPVVARRFPVSQIAAAYAVLERNEVFGKVVVHW